MARSSKGPTGSRFGVGEWFGKLFSAMTLEERIRCVEASKARRKEDRLTCPFKFSSNGGDQPCTKQSGVCSLRLYHRDEEGEVHPYQGNQGALRCLCPHRFKELGAVNEWIGEELLGTKSPLAVGEVPFLKPDVLGSGSFLAESTMEQIEEEGGSVGRIDNVLIHPDLSYLRWCAVEMQAVYFSGPALSDDYSIFVDPGIAGIPFPGKIRRPDYRSSGPKRLMPQLQIKVPTLRRWGKKMAVVVDEAFFASLGRMDNVLDVSNSDIAWFIVGFEEGERTSRLVPRGVRYTTLERAVEGLTAGLPVSLGQFEAEIRGKLGRSNL